MERRQMLKYLLAGGLSAGVSAPLAAQQQQQPRPATRSVTRAPEGSQVEQTAGTATLGNQAEPVVVNPQELERVLLDWEQKTAKITKLRGQHERYEYDSDFLIDKRAIGSFWFESPDKGRIDFNVKGQPAMAVRKFTPDGKPYQVQAHPPTLWTCDGANILNVNITDKTYDQLAIPLHQRGENVMDGPLPFLFGMKAEKMKTRYRMTLGSKHNKTGQSGRTEYHVVAAPRERIDSREWSRAEVLLDAEWCLPTAIRLIDPGGSKETVYVFDLNEMKANENFPWLSNPFKPRLSGYKLQQTATRELDLETPQR